MQINHVCFVENGFPALRGLEYKCSLFVLPSNWIPDAEVIQAELTVMLMCHHVNGRENRDGLERDCTFVASIGAPS